MERLSYYTCFECKDPYFGGLKECGGALEEEGKEFKEEELVCGKCCAKNVGGNVTCKVHKEDFIEYKCRYCCKVAIFFCWGNTHFCEPCHNDPCRIAALPQE